MTNATLLTKPALAGSLPVYVQIAEELARGISAGHFALGTRLPPERELAEQFSVAVGTIRKSLAQLTDMGLIEKRQGSGNYVRSTENSSSIYGFFRLELPGGGGMPSAEILGVDSLSKPADLPRGFGTAPNAHRFRRLRFLDKVPAALEEIWLDGSVAARLDHDEISQSLYHYYREVLGLRITRAEDWVSAAPVPGWSVPDFPVAQGQMTGFIERRGFAQDGRWVEYSRTWFDPSRVRYVARLT